MSDAQKRYTQEEVNKLVALYAEHGTEGLELIAEELKKPVRSIRSKLVKEGIYRPVEKTSTRKLGPSKKDLLNELEEVIGFDTTGFSGSTKEALSNLIVYLNRKED